MGRLTTHVLDTSLGSPAQGIQVELYRLAPDRIKAGQGITNTDGRLDGALLEGDEFTAGDYELLFLAGDYFDRNGQVEPERKFLDKVVIRFCVSDPDAHYHVPLLLSPFGYTTYRGS